MKIVMVGAGGVGGVFGARLLQAGADVAFVARGAHLAALQGDGLRVESQAHGDLHVPHVRASDDPAQLGVADWVIVSVKLADSEAAVRLARPLVGPQTTVLSLQNGVTKDDLLQREFGRAAVVGGVAYVGACIDRPGVIHQIGAMQGIDFGEYDGSDSERARQLLAVLRKAGITAHVSTDIRRTIWEKFVLLVGVSGATCVMRATMGPIRANPHARAFLLQLMQETVAVGRAQGIELPADYAENRLTFIDGMPEAMDSSMHHDLRTGRPLEVEWLSGTVADLGAKAGIATPANSAVRSILALHAA